MVFKYLKTIGPVRQRFPDYFRRRTRAQKMLGFTLMEICISVAIVGVLSAIAVPNMISYRERVRFTDTLVELKEISGFINLYYAENDEYPDSLADIGMDDRRDKWDNPYGYFNVDKSKPKFKGARKDKNLHPINTDYDLYSNGPDGNTNKALTAKASWDDIMRANDGAYWGNGEDY